MNVQNYLKDANINSVMKIFKSDEYKLKRKGLKNRIKLFLKYIQLITPSVLDKQGIINVAKYHNMCDDDIIIYVHSSLIYPDDDITYAYFDQKWEDVLSYEVVVEDGIAKNEAQANIIFEMTYLGTDIQTRVKNTKNIQSISD